MRPKTITLTGSGAGTTNSVPFRLNWRAPTTSLAFKTSGATTGFTVQFTMDNPNDYASGTAWAAAATWYNVETPVDMTGITAAAVATLDSPAQGVRLQADANGTNTGSLTIIQSDNR